MKRFCIGIISALLIFISYNTESKEMVEVPERQLTTEQQQQLASGCEPASAHQELNVNNVRARIMNGGDMWWDLVGNPRYEVPKVTGDGTRRHSMFAGSLWIGGFDPGGNLRLAAMTYRQSGEDFWPGPLDTTSANITAERCDEWDRMWRITREEIEAFREDPANITDAIREWPAHGNPAQGESQQLAPFVDVNGSGFYEPQEGDYPQIQGDQSIWYVYNDRGNVHTESGAASIGLEVHTEAFAFQTNDEINNATFYDHTVINRSRDRLDSTYFGKWADPDVGYAFNDYVGSDPDRNLGYAYVGEEYDPGATGYGHNPPSIGTIFFSGPEGDDGEEIGLENFVFYNNTFEDNGNPERAIHYYNYLNAHWKDGSPMCDAGNGFRTCGQGDPTSYMYPDDPRDSDGWSEVTAENPVGDRRHLQSSGPFTLQPGAVNDVTVGIVWARTGSGGNLGSLDLLFHSTDVAQQLFDNDFELLDGPNAPEMEVTELDRKLVLELDNTNEVENYQDSVAIGATDEYVNYRFQGYKIFQLRNASVSQTDLDDPDEARLIYQGDIRDSIDQIINRSFDPEVNEFNYEMMVDGESQGVDHTFEITNDQFADEDDRLVNFRPYHFMVVAYAVADNPDVDQQYVQGRLNVQSYTGIPSNPKHRFGGANVPADYGSQPQVTRLSGIGNQGLPIDLSEATLETALTDYSVDQTEYALNRAPFDIKVTNPLNIDPVSFELEIVDNPANTDEVVDSSATWILRNLDTGDEYHSDTTLSGDNEQILKDYGFSLRINQVNQPGFDPDAFIDNGFIEASMEFDDHEEEWLSGVSNQELEGSPLFWIRSGQVPGQIDDDYEASIHSAQISENFLDPNSAYGNILDGIIGPFALAAGGNLGNPPSFISHGPRPLIGRGNTPMSNLHSVDLVFTNQRDETHWTRSPVVETGEQEGITQGKQSKFFLRDHPSLNIDSTYDESSTGMGWFPGYAINVETGDRLNIMYGEASDMPDQNGRDMVWNPTQALVNQSSGGGPAQIKFGGKHFIYIVNSSHPQNRWDDLATNYDEGETLHEILSEGSQNTQTLREAYSNVTWVMNPMLEQGFQFESWDDGFIPTDVKINIRVNRAFAKSDGDNPTYQFEFDDLAVQREDRDIAEDNLDDVGIVPNPYYASSFYETSQLDNRARIINVPRRATISIYSQDGTLVRQFSRDQTDDAHQTYLDWNLQNHEGVPVSGGVYIVHVDAEDAGQTTFKWFAVTKPLDLDTF